MSSAPPAKPITAVQGLLALGGLLGGLVIFALFAWGAEHFIEIAVRIAYSYTWHWGSDWSGDAWLLAGVFAVFVVATAGLIGLNYLVKVHIFKHRSERLEIIFEALWNVALVIGLIIGGWYAAAHERAVPCFRPANSQVQQESSSKA